MVRSSIIFTIALSVFLLGVLEASAQGWQQPYDRSTPGNAALIHFDEYFRGDPCLVGVQSNTDKEPGEFRIDDPSPVYLDNSNPVPHAGFGSYLEVTDDGGTLVNGTTSSVGDMSGDMTLEAWINIKVDPATNNEDFYTLFRMPSSWSSVLFWITVDTDTGIRYGHLEDDGTGGNQWKYVHASAIGTNQWRHLKITREVEPNAVDANLNDYKVSIYFDGVLDVQETWSGYSLKTAGDSRFYIGDGPAGSRPLMDTSIDEVRLSPCVSKFCGSGCYLPSDLDQDCYVNFQDFTISAFNFLEDNVYSANEPWDVKDDETAALIHLDEYLGGDPCQIEVEWNTSKDPNVFVILDTNQAYLDDSNPVPYPGFGKYLHVEETSARWAPEGPHLDPNSYIGTTEAVSDMNGPMTLEVWLHFEKNPLVNGQDFYRVFTMPCEWVRHLDVQYTSGGKIVYGHRENDAAGDPGPWEWVSSASVWPTGEWNHLTITRDMQPTGEPNEFDYTVKIYFDGLLDAERTWTGYGLSKLYADYLPEGERWVSNRFFIGGGYDAARLLMDTLIDEIRILPYAKEFCSGGSYLPGDLDRDCKVDMDDLYLFVEDWLKCNKESDPDCEF